MRDDASRARLEEMGFALYLPRGARAAGAAPERMRARVALIARSESASARALLAAVARALAFARVAATVASDVAKAGEVAGIVVFGASLAREIGAAVPVERKKSIEWVSAAEPSDVAGNVAAKRALWSQLKGLALALAKTPG